MLQEPAYRMLKSELACSASSVCDSTGRSLCVPSSIYMCACIRCAHKYVLSVRENKMIAAGKRWQFYNHLLIFP